jgi:hypothetical protein
MPIVVRNDSGESGRVLQKRNRPFVVGAGCRLVRQVTKPPSAATMLRTEQILLPCDHANTTLEATTTA